MFLFDYEKDTMKRLFTDLVVIEGSDGSGKKTQSTILIRQLKQYTNNAILLDFPDYDSKTGKLVKSMLDGEFSNKAEDLNAYFTSPMYSIDRYQYLKRMCLNYSNGYRTNYPIAIANRYTQSNLIHQGARLFADDLIEYWNWLYDFEYNKLCIKKPSVVVYLYLPYEKCFEMIHHRAEEENTTIDINETKEYLALVDDNIKRLRHIVDWKFVECLNENGEMKSAGEINREIRAILSDPDNGLVYNKLFKD